VMAGTNAIHCGPDGKDLKITRLPESDAAIRRLLFGRHVNAFCNPTLIFRKAAWARCGGERSCFGHAHDLDLNLRLAEQGEVCNLRSPSLRYRLHAAQVSSTEVERQAACAVAAFHCATARQRGIPEPTFIESTQPVDSEALQATGVGVRELDEDVLSNIVGQHERLCLLGDLDSAWRLRQQTCLRYAHSAAWSRHAALQPRDLHLNCVRRNS
jgi:hypothetical protein